MTNDKLLRAYEMGFETALQCYLKVPSKDITNPYTHKALRLEWRRGWLQGCDEVLQRLRKEGKLVDVC